METIKISNCIHPQSGKVVPCIVILGKEYVYSDKKGYGTFATIDRKAALKIIDKFPSQKTSRGIPVFYPDRMIGEEYKLSWNYVGKNKYYLSISGYNSRNNSTGTHIWRSIEIDSN